MDPEQLKGNGDVRNGDGLSMSLAAARVRDGLPADATPYAETNNQIYPTAHPHSLNHISQPGSNYTISLASPTNGTTLPPINQLNSYAHYHNGRHGATPAPRMVSGLPYMNGTGMPPSVESGGGPPPPHPPYLPAQMMESPMTYSSTRRSSSSGVDSQSHESSRRASMGDDSHLMDFQSTTMRPSVHSMSTLNSVSSSTMSNSVYPRAMAMEDNSRRRRSPHMAPKIPAGPPASWITPYTHPNAATPTPGLPYAFPDPHAAVHDFASAVRYSPTSNTRPYAPSIGSASSRSGVVGMGATFSRSPQLRVSHKLAERERRKEQKILFDKLRDVLPMDPGLRGRKWEILSSAIEYIDELTQSSELLHNEIDRLQKNQAKMEEQIAALQKHLNLGNDQVI